MLLALKGSDLLFTGATIVSGNNKYPDTPDGRYFVVRGRLWRKSNPGLAEPEREELVHQLMDARHAVSAARRVKDAVGEAHAHAAVDRTKVALGERGAVWWNDGAPDFNRHMVRNTPYAGWFAGLATPP